MDAVQYVKDKTGAPPCADDQHQQNTEQCQKQMWEWSVRNTCSVATAAAGEAAGFLCENGGEILAKYTWPIVKNLMMPLGEALQDGIMAVIPDSWEAKGVFCPECEVGQWFWGHTTFDPSTDVMTGPYRVWLDAVKAVEVAWAESLKLAHLPADTPFVVYSSLLIPHDPADRLVDASGLKHPGNVLVELPGGSMGIPEQVTDAEQALVLWMDGYVKGTRTIQTYKHGDGFIANSIWPGKVLDYGNYGNAEWGYGIRGRGPFGLQLWNWPEGCAQDASCHKEFNRLVNRCWGYRLAALQKALPEVVGAVFAQVASMSPGSDPVAFRNKALSDIAKRRGAMSRAVDGCSEDGCAKGSGAWVWALALGVLGAGGYGVYRWHKARSARK